MPAADEEGVDAFGNREQGAGEEHEHGNEERPEETLASVAERMVFVRRLLGPGQRDPEQHLVAGVCE